MTAATAPAFVSARAGDLLSLEGESFLLWSACGAPAAVLACLTHQTRLANQGQLEMHIEAGGEHVIAAFCSTHGWEAVDA